MSTGPSGTRRAGSRSTRRSRSCAATRKSIKGVITASQPGRRDLEDIYVDAVIVLTAPDAALVDQGGRDAPNVTTLKKAAAFFQNSTRIPAGKSKNISAHHNMVLKALQGVAKPRSGPLRFGNWEVIEKLGGTDSYVEYRAFNIFAGQRLERAAARVPGRPVQAAGGARDAAPPHLERVPRAQLDAGPPEHRRRARLLRDARARTSTFLVTEDVPGQALRVHIEKPTLALTFDQKTTIAGDLLNALVHLQANKVVHRNISPANILVGTDGRMRLTGFDFARAGADRSRTIAQEIVDDLEPAYMAPEVHGEPSRPRRRPTSSASGSCSTSCSPASGRSRRRRSCSTRARVFAVKPSAASARAAQGLRRVAAEALHLRARQASERRVGAHRAEDAHRPERSVGVRGEPALATPPEPPAPQLDYSNSAAADAAHAEVRRREAPRKAGLVRRRVQGHRHARRRLARDEARAARPALDARAAEEGVQRRSFAFPITRTS